MLYFGRISSWWVFFLIQDLHLNFHSFLGFRHRSDSSVKEMMPLSATLPLAIGFEMFLVSISIIVIPKVNHTLLKLISKKKLGSFNNLVNAYFQCFIYFTRYEHFLASIVCKASLELLNRIQPILERFK